MRRRGALYRNNASHHVCVCVFFVVVRGFERSSNPSFACLKDDGCQFRRPP